jgi:hypothetical protein
MSSEIRGGEEAALTLAIGFDRLCDLSLVEGIAPAPGNLFERVSQQWIAEEIPFTGIRPSIV